MFCVVRGEEEVFWLFASGLEGVAFTIKICPDGSPL